MKQRLFDLDKIKRIMLRKYPTFGSVISNVKYEILDDNSVLPTAATDGKTIYINEKFMSNLTEDEQVGTLAHEVCHIAFNHVLRSEG